MSVVNDIAKHFDTRLHQLVLDTYDTCRSGGVSTNDAARMLVAVLRPRPCWAWSRQASPRSSPSRSSPSRTGR